MSQQEEKSQPTVRHIPIFVEGRSEPLVNRVPETQPSNNSSSSSIPDMPRMDMPRMDMPSHNTSDFFKHGSIFDRARDFPVRSFPNSSFFNKSSPAREASPARQVPVYTDSSSNVPSSQQQPQQQQQQSQTRGSSVPRQTPSPPSAAQQQQQYQQEQAKRYQQYQQEQQQAAAHDQTDSQPKKSTPPPPSANDPISKIQKIQRDVLQIFDQVEKFQGNKEGKKDKTYMYLDEMLTQNLLKLDSIDAEDQPQIKSARKEAIKSINHCIAVLEAKAEAAGAAANDTTNEPSNSVEHQQVPNGTTDRTGSGASLSHSSSNSSSQQQKQSD